MVGKVRFIVGMCTLLLALGLDRAGAQEEPPATVEKLAIVYSCETPDCNEPDGVKEPMPGATVTAFAADGTEVDSCTTGAGGQCPLTIPAAEDGTFEVVAATGFEGYSLVSSVPERTGEGGDGREWTFVPPAGAPAPETRDVVAVVYSCETADCTDADGVKDPMPGATVTSYTADGTELDACTTSDSGNCDLTIPAAEDGTYEIVAAAGFESYTLASSTPEVTGEGGDGREWTFVPGEEAPGEGVAVNVVACRDARCDDAVTMDGAELVSFEDGVEIDRCTVTSAPEDFDGCTLLIGADRADVEITPPADYAGYVLLSEEPEMYESPEGGPIHLWIFVPVDEEPAPAAPGATEAAVTGLPSTGAGMAGGNDLPTLLLALAGVGAVMLGITTMRPRRG